MRFNEMIMKQGFYSRKEAARSLSERGIPTAPATLAKLATTGGGPEMCKFGRRVFYTTASLNSWIESRLFTCRSTSEQPLSGHSRHSSH
jgi:hypothetical protein